jgi:hypothetical protein
VTIGKRQRTPEESGVARKGSVQADRPFFQQNRPAWPIDSAAFLEAKVWNSLFESSL